MDRAKGLLGLLMSEVIGLAFHGGYHSLVSHKYDFCGGVDPHVGVVSDVMHGCYFVGVSCGRRVWMM